MDLHKNWHISSWIHLSLVIRVWFGLVVLIFKCSQFNNGRNNRIRFFLFPPLAMSSHVIACIVNFLWSIRRRVEKSHLTFKANQMFQLNNHDFVSLPTLLKHKWNSLHFPSLFQRFFIVKKPLIFGFLFSFGIENCSSICIMIQIGDYVIKNHLKKSASYFVTITIKLQVKTNQKLSTKNHTHTQTIDEICFEIMQIEIPNIRHEHFY